MTAPSRRRSGARALWVSALLALAVGAAPERAAASDAPAWAYDLADELMSPFCPGRTLSDCPSPQAGSLKAWIVVQAAAGRTRADVEEELYARYGDVLRAAPRAEGFGTTAYLIPAAVFVAGGALLTWFLRRVTRAAPPGAGPAPAPLDPELERRLDEVLSR